MIMPDPSNNRASEEEVLVPGVLSITPTSAGKSVIRLGAAAGWMVPKGIGHWERELSFVARSQMTVDLARALRGTRPFEQIAPKRFPLASRATEQSPMLGLCTNLVADARKQGVRVHTVGVDRVSSGFYYFAEGGTRDPVRVQGSLVEMLSPSLTGSSTNAEISSLLENLIDRLLLSLSEGEVSELDVELADSLPRLSRDGTGLAGTDIDAFDALAHNQTERSQRWATAARELADVLATATGRGQTSASVPLYGESRQEIHPALEVQIGAKLLKLPPYAIWTVSGGPREEVKREQVKRVEARAGQPAPIATPQMRAEPKAPAEPAPPPEPTAPAVPSRPVVVLHQSSQSSGEIAGAALPAAPAPALDSPLREPQKPREPEKAVTVGAEPPSQSLPLPDGEARAHEVKPVAPAEAMAVEHTPGPSAAAPQPAASRQSVAKTSARAQRSTKTATATTIALLLAALATVVACLVLNRLWTLYH